MSRFGSALVATGALALPAILGVAVGYWVSDVGVPWMPDTVGILAVAAIVAGAAILVGSAVRGRLYAESVEGRRLRKRSLAGLGLVALAALARLAVEWTQQPSHLSSLSETEYNAAFEADRNRYLQLSAELAALLPHVEAPGALRPGADGLLSADQERLLLDAWSALFDQALVLDEIRRYHEDYYRFDPSRLERSRHLRSFLLTFAAEASLVQAALRFDALIGGKDDIRHFLDAPHPELPEASWSRFRQEFLGSRDQARIRAGVAWLATLDGALGARAEAGALGLDPLRADLDRSLAVIRAAGLLDTGAATVAADAQVLRRGARRVLFPTQAHVAEWMGDEKLRRIGRYLIPPEQVAVLEKRLEPGDVMVARKNWYLSNVGLPGFWPHAILYIGDPAELAAAFDDDPEVAAWVEAQAGRPMPYSTWLGTRFPAWVARHHGEVDGEPIRVIEAISEGVVLNSLDHVAGDYLAALRPRRSPLARAQAVAVAFELLGRPYDFDFDFATDHAIVCSELVWRAWRPASGKEGLDIPTVEKVGRSTLPANEFIRVFDEQHGREDRLFDFVGFIDAIEREGRTVVSDEAALRASHRRTKWDIAQK